MRQLLVPLHADTSFHTTYLKPNCCSQNLRNAHSKTSGSLFPNFLKLELVIFSFTNNQGVKFDIIINLNLRKLATHDHEFGTFSPITQPFNHLRNKESF